jgi:glycosyltransferase involved in cell wall biosynthesis
VYDCMDELSGFAGAPPGLREQEAQLMKRADLMTTGGYSLYEAKRALHPNVHPFPSSVDVAHFRRARTATAEPPDQASLPRPRLGFFGVIDERMDLALLAGVAAARPQWQLVLVGPVVKIDAARLPRAANVHYLGSQPYDTLPSYLAGWDVALMPFARNEATRYISPTKTPEYLAAGRPVVSTSIRDVVRPYGQRGLVRIADTVEDFVSAVEAALVEDSTARLRSADDFLRHTSWDATWAEMKSRLDACVAAAAPAAPAAA